MSKHTPGPWRVGGRGEYLNQLNIDPVIGVAYGHDIELMANARLIAAAPDLLNALVMVLDDPNALDGRPRTYEIVCAAIAKAKGEV